MNREERGFTLLELVIVLVFVGIIAAIAIPNYLSLVRKTHVMQAVADLQAVRAAAYIYYGDTMTWPKETPPGVMPPELKDRIPIQLTFSGPDYLLDWDNWYTVRGKLLYPASGVGAGIGIISADEKLVEGVERILANAPMYQVSATKTTLRIAGANGI
jgi:prepilin-type N-terminal cleavage/methylation domain-containing protein